MKKLITVLLVVFAPISLAQDLTEDQYDTAMELLSNGVSKAMYLEKQCGLNIDRDSFRDVAKLFAFKEGVKLPENIDWAGVASSGHAIYQSYAQKHPDGSQCDSLKEALGNMKHFLIEHHDFTKKN